MPIQTISVQCLDTSLLWNLLLKLHTIKGKSVLPQAPQASSTAAASRPPRVIGAAALTVYICRRSCLRQAPVSRLCSVHARLFSVSVQRLHSSPNNSASTIQPAVLQQDRQLPLLLRRAIACSATKRQELVIKTARQSNCRLTVMNPGCRSFEGKACST